MEEIFEVIVAENFLKLIIDTKAQILGGQRILSRINNKKSTTRQITFKLQKTKDKGKNLKEAGEACSCRRKRVRIIVNFTSKTMQIIEWSDIIKVMEEKTTT